MVALHGLNSASVLLRQLSTAATPAPQRQDPVFSSAPILKDEFLKGVAPEKMVGSAIFNALASASEKEAETMKYVLNYIEENYVDIDKSLPSLAAMGKESPEVEGAVETVKKLGAALKDYVMNNPGIVHEMLGKIMMGRPDLSKASAMPFLMNELGERMNGKTSVKA